MSESKDQLISRWFSDHANELFAFTMQRIDDRNLAMDLIQDTFLSAINAFDDFDERSSAKTWLIAILKRKIIDHWRQKESRKTQPLSYYFRESMWKNGDFLVAARPAGMLAEVEEKWNKEERIQNLYDCIERLPEVVRSIIIDRLDEEKSSDELCKEYGLSTSNFWVTLHRARLQLRECLEKKGQFI